MKCQNSHSSQCYYCVWSVPMVPLVDTENVDILVVLYISGDLTLGLVTMFVLFDDFHFNVTDYWFV